MNFISPPLCKYQLFSQPQWHPPGWKSVLFKALLQLLCLAALRWSLVSFSYIKSLDKIKSYLEIASLCQYTNKFPPLFPNSIFHLTSPNFRWSEFRFKKTFHAHISLIWLNKLSFSPIFFPFINYAFCLWRNLASWQSAKEWGEEWEFSLSFSRDLAGKASYGIHE